MVTGFKIDALLGWPGGRAERLAKKSKLPHYVLPTGEIRFKTAEILALITPGGPLPPASALLDDLPEGGSE